MNPKCHTTKLLAFALAIGLSGMITIPGDRNGTIVHPGAIAFGTEIVKVTAKRVEALTPDKCIERGMTLEQCVHGLRAEGWDWVQARSAVIGPYEEEARRKLREAAKALCREAMQSTAGRFGLAAGSVVAMREACPKLVKPKLVTACAAAVAGVAAVCAAAGLVTGGGDGD
ncbi:MAG: hypothetical protein OXP28_14535 [Gammaproteobacteria bacterium]|nr:hypothetical protein [Gammaproteobacteria bacterium]